MKIHAALIVVALILGAAGAAAQSPRVGVVNLARIEKESALAQRASEALKAEFGPRNEQIQSLQRKIAASQARLEKEGGTLPASERQALERELSAMMRQSDQMVLAARDDFELRRREVGAKLIEEAQAAVKAIAEKGKFDLILQEAAYARAGIDITDQVLKEMARRAGGR